MVGNMVKTPVVIGIIPRRALVAISCVGVFEVSIVVERVASHVDVVIIVLHVVRVDRDFAAEPVPCAVVPEIGHVAPFKIFVTI
jgi:hypothetical protein